MRKLPWHIYIFQFLGEVESLEISLMEKKVTIMLSRRLTKRVKLSENELQPVAMYKNRLNKFSLMKRIFCSSSSWFLDIYGKRNCCTCMYDIYVNVEVVNTLEKYTCNNHFFIIWVKIIYANWFFFPVIDIYYRFIYEYTHNYTTGI